MITKAYLSKICSLRNIILIAFFLLITLFTSCVTQRNVEYIKDKKAGTVSFTEPIIPDYKLKPHDELLIQINSLDDEAANVFLNSNNMQSLNYSYIDPYGASLLAYPVDKEGYLLLPVIGSVLVMDKTLEETRVLLQNSLKNILNQPAVTVKLVNRYVSILGEVNSPGHYPYTKDKLSIFDAIGIAGDMTEYANRESVTLVRNENGENIRINLNLTRPDILSSGYYNIRPNDIIYVKPLRKKFWGMRQFPFSVVLSAITTGLLIYNVVK